ncbi:MAG: hypothetical protein MRERC_9c059 [Mycoplasmataceae bacterium RC_NB112A]|nr:MAG: hypothetical protein MRERC_9c059 [Mycoplasmataceae bacterium RC_NB112A]
MKIDSSCLKSPVTKLNLTKNSNLKEIYLQKSKLTEIKIDKKIIEKIWEDCKLEYSERSPITKWFFPLIDVSDLDRRVYDYDWSKVGDIEYHKFYSDGVNEYICLDSQSLKDLALKILVRCIVVSNRLNYGIDEKKESDLNLSMYRHKYFFRDYSEIFYETFLDDEPGSNKLSFNRGYASPWEYPRNLEKFNKLKKKLEKMVDEVLDWENFELAKRLQNLPYLDSDYKFPTTTSKEAYEKMKELVDKVKLEREEGKKALKAAEEQKDEEIARLKKQIEELKIQLETTQK